MRIKQTEVYLKARVTYRVGKMTLEKVPLIKNSKQVKFWEFLRLAVSFKINSRKSYWAQIHRKHLSCPVCSQAILIFFHTGKVLKEQKIDPFYRQGIFSCK